MNVRTYVCEFKSIIATTSSIFRYYECGPLYTDSSWHSVCVYYTVHDMCVFVCVCMCVKDYIASYLCT